MRHPTYHLIRWSLVLAAWCLWVPWASAQVAERFRSFSHVPATSADAVPMPASVDFLYKLLAFAPTPTLPNNVFAVRYNGMSYNLMAGPAVSNTGLTAVGPSPLGFDDIRAIALGPTRQNATSQRLYVAGNSTSFGGIAHIPIMPPNNLMYPLSATLTQTGGTPQVNALAVSQASGTVYIGGLFDKAGSMTVNNVVAYVDATDTFTVLNSSLACGTYAPAGVDGAVTALAVYTSGNISHLFLAGSFTQANGGLPAPNRILRHDGLCFRQVLGMPAFAFPFLSLLVVPIDASAPNPALPLVLYASGNFTTDSSGKAYNGVVKYTPWSGNEGNATALGGQGLAGFPGSPATVVALRVFNASAPPTSPGFIIVLGSFSQANISNGLAGPTLNNVAIYDPLSDAFRPLQGSVPSTGPPNYFNAQPGIQGLRTPYPSGGSVANGDLAVARDALLIGSDLLLAFDGDHVGNGFQAPGRALFSLQSNMTQNSVAPIRGEWSPTFGADIDGIGFDDEVSAVLEDIDGLTGPLNDPPAIVFAGQFARAGNTWASRLVRYTPQAGFEPLTDSSRSFNGIPSFLLTGASRTTRTASSVSAITFFNGQLVIGGQFRIAGETLACCLAVFNKTGGGIKALAPGTGVSITATDTSVEALAVMGSSLYVGGVITGVVPAQPDATRFYVLVWNGTSLRALRTADGSKVTDDVLALHAFSLPLPAPLAGQFIDVLAIGGRFSAGAVLYSNFNVTAATEGRLVATGGSLQGFFVSSLGAVDSNFITFTVRSLLYMSKPNALVIAGSLGTTFNNSGGFMYSFSGRQFSLLDMNVTAANYDGTAPIGFYAPRVSNIIYSLTRVTSDAFAMGGSFLGADGVWKGGALSITLNRIAIYNTTTRAYSQVRWLSGTNANLAGVAGSGTVTVIALGFTRDRQLLLAGQFSKSPTSYTPAMTLNGGAGYNMSEAAINTYPSMSPSVSNTPTPSPTSSVSRSPSLSFSPSRTRSESASVSRSPSPSSSGSSDASASVSLSPSQSAEASQSSTPSLSQSLSATFSSSYSALPSPSLSSSATRSCSETSSSSPSESVTASTTASASVSSTITPSYSQSVSGTASPTQTASFSPSQSGTPSTSVSEASSLSVSATASVSTSLSATTSFSGSATMSSSGSPSYSSQASASSSSSASEAASSSQTSTVSASNSPSSSSSASSTQTGTASSSETSSNPATPSVSSTGSTTASLTATSSLSPSPSTSQTASETGSSSATASSSGSSSVSLSTTPTPGSASPSPSQSLSSSQTPSMSPSPVTSSSTPSPSVSNSVSGSQTPSSSVAASSSPSNTPPASTSPSGSSGPPATSSSGAPTSSPSSSTSPTTSPSSSISLTIPADAILRLQELAAQSLFGSSYQSVKWRYSDVALPGTFRANSSLALAIGQRQGSLFASENQACRVFASLSTTNGTQPFKPLAGTGGSPGDPYALAFRNDTLALSAQLPAISSLSLHDCAFFFATPASGHIFFVPLAGAEGSCVGSKSFAPANAGKLLTLALLPASPARIHVDLCASNTTIVVLAIASGGTVTELRLLNDGTVATSITWTPAEVFRLADSHLWSPLACSTVVQQELQRLFLLTSTGGLLILQPVIAAISGRTGWIAEAVDLRGRFSLPPLTSFVFAPPSILVLIAEGARGSAELWAVFITNLTAVSLNPPFAAPQRRGRALALSASFPLPSAVSFDEVRRALVLADPTVGALEVISGPQLSPSAAPAPSVAPLPPASTVPSNSGLTPLEIQQVGIATGVVAVLVVVPLAFLLATFACFYRRALKRKWADQEAITKRSQAADRMRQLAQSPGSSVAVVDALSLVQDSAHDELGKAVALEILEGSADGHGGLGDDGHAFVSKLLERTDADEVATVLQRAVTMSMKAAAASASSGTVTSTKFSHVSHRAMVNKVVTHLATQLERKDPGQDSRTLRFLQGLVQAAEDDLSIGESAEGMLSSYYLNAAKADLGLPAQAALMPAQAAAEGALSKTEDNARLRLAELLESAQLVREAELAALELSVGGEEVEAEEAVWSVTDENGLFRAKRSFKPTGSRAPSGTEGASVATVKVDLASRKRMSSMAAAGTPSLQTASATTIDKTLRSGSRGSVQALSGSVRSQAKGFGTAEPEQEDGPADVELSVDEGGEECEATEVIGASTDGSGVTTHRADRASTSAKPPGQAGSVSRVKVQKRDSRGVASVGRGAQALQATSAAVGLPGSKGRLRSLSGTVQRQVKHLGGDDDDGESTTQDLAAAPLQSVPLSSKEDRGKRALEAFAVVSLDLASKKAAELIIVSAPEPEALDAPEKSAAGLGCEAVTVQKLLEVSLRSSPRRAPRARASFAPVAEPGIRTTAAPLPAPDSTGIMLNPLRAGKEEKDKEKAHNSDAPTLDLAAQVELVLKQPLATSLVAEAKHKQRRLKAAAAAKVRREAWQEARQRILLLLAVCGATQTEKPVSAAIVIAHPHKLDGVGAASSASRSRVKVLPKHSNSAAGNVNEAGGTKDDKRLEIELSPPAKSAADSNSGKAFRPGDPSPRALARPSFGGSSAFSFSPGFSADAKIAAPPASSSSPSGWRTPSSPFYAFPLSASAASDAERAIELTRSVTKKVQLPDFHTAENPMANAALAARRPSVRVLAAANAEAAGRAPRMSFALPALRSKSILLGHSDEWNRLPSSGLSLSKQGMTGSAGSVPGALSASSQYLSRTSRASSFGAVPAMSATGSSQLSPVLEEAPSQQQPLPSTAFAAMLAPQKVQRPASRKKNRFSSLGTAADAAAAEAAAAAAAIDEPFAHTHSTRSPISPADGGRDVSHLSTTPHAATGSLSFFNKQRGARLSLAHSAINGSSGRLARMSVRKLQLAFEDIEDEISRTGTAADSQK